MGVAKVKPTAMMAEFFGTFGLTYAVLASINGAFTGISTPVVASLTLALVVMTVGMISGAHVNPAITAGAWSVKKIDTSNAAAYVLAQLSGALLAWVVLSLFLGEGTADLSAAAENTWPVFFAEGIGAMIFGFGVAAAIHNKYDGVVAGATVGLALLIGLGWAAIASSAVLNPAIAASANTFNWAYVLGPILGAVLGMQLYARVLTKKGKL